MQEKRSTTLFRALRLTFPLTSPVLTGYLFLGAAYGLLMNQSGYSFIWALGMSLFVYAGSLQFAVLPLLAQSFSAAQFFLLALTVNCRHLFYGVSMLKAYQDLGALKLYLAFTLTDETFSLIAGNDAPEGVSFRDYAFWVSFLNHLYWIGATVAGFFLGDLVPPGLQGLDFVLTALFFVIALEQWRDHAKRRPVLLGLFATIFCRYLFGEKFFLIPALILILITLLVGLRYGPKVEKGVEA